MRRPLIPAVLALGALLLAACTTPDGVGGLGPDTAAVVGGEEITEQEVEDFITDEVSANPQLEAQLDDEDMRAQVESGVLSQLIIAELVRQGAAERGVEIDDDDVDAMRDTVIDDIGQDAFDDVVADMEEARVDEQLAVQALVEAVMDDLVDDVDEDAAREQFEENREQYETFEARHILTDTEEEAVEALERVEDGEDFGEVAEEVSTDQASAVRGGDLGEQRRGQLVSEFEEAVLAAEPGDVVGPVESDFGFHVIEVVALDLDPEFDDVRDEVLAEMGGPERQQALQEWLDEVAADIEVEVAERYGSWDPDNLQVVPDVEQPPGVPGEGQMPPGGEEMELDPEQLEQLEEELERLEQEGAQE